MRSVAILFLCAVVLAGGQTPLAAEQASRRPDSVPVMVGGEAELDACGGTGLVSGLRPVPGNELVVRHGPGIGFAKVAALTAGTRVWLCDSRDGWLGVVFGAVGQECGVSSPQLRRSPYKGPCSAGWVWGRFISPEAG
jgi:hypothetical protein